MLWGRGESKSIKDPGSRLDVTSWISPNYWTFICKCIHCAKYLNCVWSKDLKFHCFHRLQEEQVASKCYGPDELVIKFTSPAQKQIKIMSLKCHRDKSILHFPSLHPVNILVKNITLSSSFRFWREIYLIIIEIKEASDLWHPIKNGTHFLCNQTRPPRLLKF
jgi:hypothetical protein